MKFLGSALGLAAPLLLLAQLLTSCGSDGEGKACNPGDLHTCTCGSNDTPGTQTCKDDGSGYDECSCGATGGTGGSGGGSGMGGSAGSAMSGTAGSMGMPAPSPFDGEVGAPCSADSDCAGAPLVCVGVNTPGRVGPGGPANGYCSLPCTTDDECSAVDNISFCNQGAGWCYGLCLPGQSNAKCRDAQACYSLVDDNSIGACIPRCASDAECGAGLFCDPGLTGTCLPAAPPGGKVGDPCTRETQATDCASAFCFQLANGAGSFCSAGCTLNLLDGCGYDRTSGGVREAACFVSFFSGGTSLDFGLCIPLCDTTADCAQSGAGWVCEPFTDPAEVQQLGRQGECIPGSLSPSAGADAGADAGN